MSKASAPGKVILTGEHSVVYGKPAVAGALDLRCEATTEEADQGLVINALDFDKIITYSSKQLLRLEGGSSVYTGFDNLAGAVLSVLSAKDIALQISVTSEVPVGAGLGSSAATAVAIIGSIMNHLELDFDPIKISESAFEAEKIAHGTPSGIDNSVSALGGLIRFQDGKVDNIELNDSIPLIVTNTNVHRNTKKLVTNVRDRLNRIGPIVERVIDEIGNVSDAILQSLQNRDYRQVGELFDINHGLLDAIGVGHPMLSKLVYKARSNGALGAKLTGAGGGGCMIALVEEHMMDNLMAKLDSEEFDVYQTSISHRGVEFH